MSYNEGDRVGDYEIVSVLGAGGMGKVYKVRNLISDRVEAMKVLLPNLEADPDLADRFMREIKVQASLHHPNIATLHTAQRIGNQLVMLIEFVDGVTLEAELRRGPVPVPQAVDYISQVLSALSYAHIHGVVHRDIKPANIMLMPNGSVKLMDFGIARLSADRRLTQTGRTVGSLYYMSPEQIQGAVDLDARSDLYSLGVTTYELLTARRPFQGDSDYSIMAAHLSARPVPPLEIDPSMPAMLNEVILMAIAKEPGKRFQTAEAFRSALQSVASGMDLPASSVTKVVAGGSKPASLKPVREPVAPAPAPVSSKPAPLPAPEPQPPVAAKASGRRGLYMAIGSLVTVAVLAIAALQGPKLFHGSEASTTPNVAVVREQHATPAQQEPVSVPAPQTSTPAEASPSRVSPTSPQVAQQLAPRNTPPPRQTASSYVPPQAQPAIPQGIAQPQSTPSQGASAPAAVREPAVDTARIQALQEHRELLILLGTRANSARASLAKLKQDQARMGLGLRGDVATAEQRIGFYLDDAEGALKAGDPDRMKKSLDSAERAIETVERFLGR